MDLPTIETFYDEGKFHEVLEHLAFLSDNWHESSLSVNEWGESTFYRIRSLERVGRLEEAYILSKKAHNIKNDLKDKTLLLGLIAAECQSLMWMNRWDELSTVLFEGETILNALSPSEWETGKRWICEFLNTQGHNYLNKRKFKSALKKYQHGLKQAELLGNADLITTMLNNLGSVNSMIGEFNLAIVFLKRVLKIEESRDSPFGIAVVLNSLGDLYYQIGDLNNATECGLRSCHLFESLGNDIFIMNTIFLLILVSLAKNDHTSAQSYLKQLKSIKTERSGHRQFGIISKLAEALIMKNNHRLSEKFQAQEIFKEILSETDDFFIRIIALKHQCELLFLELSFTNEIEVFEEVKIIILQLREISEFSESIYFYVETLIIQAKLSIIEGNLEKAKAFFDQANELAKNCDSNVLIRKVREEKNKFNDEYYKWQDLINQNASLHERLEYGQLVQYIKKVRIAIELTKKNN